MSGKRFSIIIACAFGAILLTNRPAMATVHSFEAFLDGLQETPSVATPGSGYASMTLDDVTNEFTLTGTFQDLVGTTTDAHVHGPAAPGVAASVMFGITFTSGVSAGNLSFSGTISSTNAGHILNELAYINVHSTFRPGGEIRGQILAVPEPSAALLVGCAMMPLIARRRRMA